MRLPLIGRLPWEKWDGKKVGKHKRDEMTRRLVDMNGVFCITGDTLILRSDNQDGSYTIYRCKVKETLDIDAADTKRDTR